MALNLAHNTPLHQACLLVSEWFAMAQTLPRISELDEMPASRLQAIGSDTNGSSEEILAHAALAELALDGIGAGMQASLNDLHKNGSFVEEEELRQNQPNKTQTLS